MVCGSDPDFDVIVAPSVFATAYPLAARALSRRCDCKRGLLTCYFKQSKAASQRDAKTTTLGACVRFANAYKL